MTPEEYAARQRVISAAVSAVVYQIATFWSLPSLSVADWLRLLQYLWPEVRQRRIESASLARQFYDSQRGSFHPDLPRNDVPLEGNDFPVFVKSMEPVRKKMQQANSPKDAATRFALQVVREVENAGRRQIINAVKADEAVAEKVDLLARDAPVRQELIVPNREPERPSETRSDIRRLLTSDLPTFEAQASTQPAQPPSLSRPVQGWARVATGNETCAWCLMLISRGPVYSDANTAGLDLDNESAVEMIAAGEDVSEYMEQWHTGCDCKVVPVFDLDNWSGKAASARALELWIEAGREADRFMEQNPGRVHLTGKNKGQPITENEETILALRRMLERGEISITEFAGLAA